MDHFTEYEPSGEPVIKWSKCDDEFSWAPSRDSGSCKWWLLPFYIGPLAAWRVYRALWANGWRPFR